jgi:hypothetical protein
MYVYWKMATGSEPATWTWGISTAAPWIVQVVCVQNPGDLTTPTDVSGIQATLNDTSIRAPSLTPTRQNGLMIGFFGTKSNSTFTPDPNMIELQDAAFASAPQCALETAWQPYGPASASGGRMAGATISSQNIGWLGIVLGPPGAPTNQPVVWGSVSAAGTNAAPTCTNPSGTSPGDLIYACLFYGVTGTLPSVTGIPPGLTLLDTIPVGGNALMSVYFGPAGGLLVWATSASCSWVVQVVLVVNPGDAVTPTDAHAIQANASNTNIAAPAITTTLAYDLLIGFFGARVATTISPDSRMWEAQDQPSSTLVTLETAWEAFAGGIGTTLGRNATAAAAAANIGWLGAVKGPAVLASPAGNADPLFWSL